VGLLGVVAEGLTNLVDEHRQIGPGHVGGGPEKLVQLLLGDRSRAPLNEELQQLEGFGCEVYGLPVAGEQTGFIVQDKLAETDAQGGLPVR
jgi:hypothetical protein